MSLIGGNRQINAALHRIAITQIRAHHPAKDLYASRKANGDGGLEALRVLKRDLSNTEPSRPTPKHKSPSPRDPMKGRGILPPSASNEPETQLCAPNNAAVQRAVGPVRE